jgi:ribosomal protein S18 acetylase RimI-like enzyme
MGSDPAIEFELSTDVGGLTPDQLEGFFEGWPRRPSAEQLRRVLQGSYRAVVAKADSGKVVGFATSVSDGFLAAFIPLVEVLPDYRARGIGTAIMRRMLQELTNLYMVDLICDEGAVPFYDGLGMRRTVGMSVRNPSAISDRQSVDPQ